MTVYIPVLAAIVGALIYALTHGKAAELGRITFAAGMLALLLGNASKLLG